MGTVRCVLQSGGGTETFLDNSDLSRQACGSTGRRNPTVYTFYYKL